MAGITKCANKDCILRKDCFRFRSYPAPFNQSYSEYKPDKNNQCQKFIKIVDLKRVRPFYE